MLKSHVPSAAHVALGTPSECVIPLLSEITYLVAHSLVWMHLDR